jgi:hypothetical protein
MAITRRYKENVKSFFSKNKNITKKNPGDSFHQALTSFSFLGFIFSDFSHNKFLKLLMDMENNIVKFREFIMSNIRKKNVKN